MMFFLIKEFVECECHLFTIIYSHIPVKRLLNSYLHFDKDRNNTTTFVSFPVLIIELFNPVLS